VAVAVGLRTATGGTVTGIEETSLRALAKLEQVLPTRLRGRSTPCTPTLSPRRRVVHQSAVFLAGGVLEDELDRDGYGKANERVDPVPADGSGDRDDRCGLGRRRVGGSLRGWAMGFCGPACGVMLVVMLLRLDLYTGRTCHLIGHRTLAARARADMNGERPQPQGRAPARRSPTPRGGGPQT
jgi:hypothetical protein